jgi:DNA-binding response OmpR family regulator
VSGVLFTTKHREPDAIVTDLSMPGASGLDGLELARRQGMDVPVLVVSGNDSSEMRERLRHVGNTLFFRKPVDLGELAHALRDLVQLRASAGQA